LSVRNAASEITANGLPPNGRSVKTPTVWNCTFMNNTRLRTVSRTSSLLIGPILKGGKGSTAACRAYAFKKRERPTQKAVEGEHDSKKRLAP
jgi:hypothetical protein